MTFRILALSGGGYLGLFSVRVLSLLERLRGHPIATAFDLICGTSAGAITALALSLEIPACQIEEAFIAHGPKIFASREGALKELHRTSAMLRSLIRPRYAAEPLREAITSIVPPTARMGDAKHRLVLPVVNMTTGRIEIFKTPHSLEARHHANHRMADVAIAASAAPTYFPMADVENSLYVDGAIFASAPDIIGVHEAEHYLQVPSSEIEVLSIGATTGSFSLPYRSGRDYGAVKWLRASRLLSTIMSTQQQLTHTLLRHRLGERYMRIDTVRGRSLDFDLAFDGATEAGTKTLLGLADHAFQHAIKSERTIEAVLSHAREASAAGGLGREIDVGSRDRSQTARPVSGPPDWDGQ